MLPEKDNQRFPQKERMKSSMTIKSVMDDGISYTCFPLKCYFRVVEGDTGVQIAVVVSKRRFKHAVDRNRVKRLMRESFRLQKKLIPQLEHYTLQMCWIFIGRELPTLPTLMTAGEQIFNKIRTHFLSDFP